MLPALVALFYVPVLVWVSIGLVLLVAFRRSGPRFVLRLAAAFLALWALLATTTLVWVLANGGLAGVLTLFHAPFVMFDPRYSILWLVGALGVLLIFSLAFTLNQLVGRGLLHLLHPTPQRWPHRLPPPSGRVSLLRYPAANLEAFSFTLLSLAGGSRRGPHRHEVIVLSDGLLDALTSVEVEAVVAHELGHVRDLDARYLTFFRTLARMMRWDPLFALFASSLTRREEYRADDDAVSQTRRPLALARALFKASTRTSAASRVGVNSFLGSPGRRGSIETRRRIERLIALAESGTYGRPEDD